MAHCSAPRTSGQHKLYSNMPSNINRRINAAVAAGAARGAARAKSRSKGSPQVVMISATRPKGKSAKVSARPKGGLDRDGAAWQRLLSDPCYAPLAHPVYPTGDGGQLVRVEQELNFANGATDTGGFLIWAPGAIGTNNCLVYGSNSGANEGVALTCTDQSSTAPGYTFLRAQASGARCVAACIQIAWPGSELDRQGMVSLGQVGGTLLTEAVAAPVLSVNAARVLCQLRTRMPDTMVEAKWRPSAGDMDWTDPSIVTPPNDCNKRGALLLTALNMPVAKGVRVRMVAVYEYQAKYNIGVTADSGSKSQSKCSFTEVIDGLDKMGGWAYNVGAGFAAMRGGARRIQYGG